jgi:hypothetical protein
MRMASFASNSLPSGLALPLAAVFVVAMRCGMVLPVLPFLLTRFLGTAAGSTATGWLFTLFIAAPFWRAAGLLVLGALTVQ